MEKLNKGVDKTFAVPVCEVKEETIPKKTDQDNMDLIWQEINALKNNRTNDSNSNRNPARSSKPKYCHYWKKNGHVQDNCYKRKNRNDPCVDKNGRKYIPQGPGNRKYLDEVSDQVSTLHSSGFQ